MRSTIARVVAGPAFMLLASCGGTPPSAPEKGPDPSARLAAKPAMTATPKVSIEDLDQALKNAHSTALAGDLTGAEDALKAAMSGLEATTPEMAKRLGDIFYNLGLLAEWQGKYSEAQRQYDEALRVQPEMGSAVLALGRLMLRNGDAGAAVNFARGRLNGREKSIALRNALNRIRLAAQVELPQVEADSKSVLREDEKNVDAMINLAVAYHRSGKFELAIAVLENAKALDPNEPEIYWRISQSRLALKDTLRARLILEEATQLEGGATAEIYNNLGVLYHAAGDFAGAELQFRKALARWPDMLAAQVNLGNALKGKQEFANALAALDKALTMSPNSGLVMYNLGILLLDGQFPDMPPVERLQKALSYFDGYKKTLPNAGKTDPVNAYIAEAQKRVIVEEKRAKQMKRLKAAKANAPAQSPSEEGKGAPEQDPPAPSDEPVPSSGSNGAKPADAASPQTDSAAPAADGPDGSGATP